MAQDPQRTRFGDISAEWLVVQCSQTGLVSVDGEDLSFVHPLFSSFLSAEAVATGAVDFDANPLERDSLVFLSVMLGDRPVEVLEALARLDIFGLASVARLAGASQRASDVAGDIIRFDEALARLAPASGAVAGPVLASERTAVCRSGQFVAFRRVRPELSGIVDSADLTAWANPGAGVVSYTCWPANPFEQISPELLSAAEVVAVFKSAMNDLRPPGSSFPNVDVDVETLLADSKGLSEKLLTNARVRQAFRRDALSKLNLSDHPIASDVEGNPRITVHTSSERPATYSVVWGQWEASVRFVADGEQWGTWLTSVEANPAVRAWDELSRDLEERLDTRLMSQAAGRHSRLPTWII
jgi:hypothetical protein